MSETIRQLVLTPEQTAHVGTLLIVLIITLDVLTSADGIPGNTPREWILRLSRWRSLGLYKASNRASLDQDGHWWGVRFIPFNYLPVSGAFVPFMLSALLGHIFHPWSSAPLGVRGFFGLFLVLGIALTVSVTTYFVRLRVNGEPPIAVIALGGVCAGLAFWPAS